MIFMIIFVEMSIDMRRWSICILLLLVCATGAMAFDWPAQTNEELKKDLLTEAQAFLDDFSHDKKLSRQLEGFITSLQSGDAHSWAGQTLSLVEKLKKQYPPTQENALVRERILRLLDYPLHINDHSAETSENEKDAFYSVVQAYINSSLETVSGALTRRRTREGVDIYQVYDMGVILRGNEYTVGVDLSRNPHLPAAYPTHSDDCVRSLVESLDILLLTHPHSDHYWPELMRAMAKAGKPVILPCEPERIGLDPVDGYMVMDKASDYYRSYGLEIHSFMGNQGETVPCNVYVIDMGGIKIVHSGDNYSTEAEQLVATQLPVNIVIAAAWNKPQRLLDVVAVREKSAPLLFIPLHINELEHSVDHRESYRELYEREDRLGHPDYAYPPLVVLDNGEHYHFSLLSRLK